MTNGLKIHTTNYVNTFIEIAADAPTESGMIPPEKGKSKTAANIQFELISKHPYMYTSDDVLFEVYAEKNELLAAEYDAAKAQFFSKGQPCFRASPLTKRYGWGVHHNEDGKIAIYGAETTAYKNFLDNPSIKKLKAMKLSR